jgi:hypothetical protein
VMPANDSSHDPSESGAPRPRAVDRERELAAETDALAELLLDIYEFCQQSAYSGRPATTPVDVSRENSKI